MTFGWSFVHFMAWILYKDFCLWRIKLAINNYFSSLFTAGISGLDSEIGDFSSGLDSEVGDFSSGLVSCGGSLFGDSGCGLASSAVSIFNK